MLAGIKTAKQKSATVLFIIASALCKGRLFVCLFAGSQRPHGIDLKRVRRIKVGVHMNSIFSPLNVGLMKISRSRFKQSKNPLLISRSYVVGCFFKFLGDFWVYLGGDSFS